MAGETPEIALARAGYRVVRVVWDDVVQNWPATSVWRRDLMALGQSN
ncbi:MAG: hypothetical protein ABR571_07655 [Jatrophihabitans sp.]